MHHIKLYSMTVQLFGVLEFPEKLLDIKMKPKWIRLKNDNLIIVNALEFSQAQKIVLVWHA